MATLSAAELRQFADQGYLVVEGVLDPERDFAPIMGEYAAILDGIADALYAEGAIASTHRDRPFAARIIEICAESGRQFAQHFDFSLPQSGVRPDTPFYAGPAMFRLLINPGLLDLVASVIGPEIASCPVQHTRMKLPRRALGANAGNGLVGTIPWHQDNGVLLPEADESTILTVWLPVNEATVENGCMRVIPRSHGRELFAHCPGGPGGLAIPDAVLPPGAPVVLPMRPGSVLLMTQSTVHSSLDNTSTDQVRISFDLRFQPTGQPTGRPAFAPAGFIARSAARPESVLRDPAIWRENWRAVRDDLAARDSPAFNRWRADAPVCA